MPEPTTPAAPPAGSRSDADAATALRREAEPPAAPDTPDGPAPDALRRALEGLSVLADPVRRDIVAQLAQGPVCTCGDLVERFDVAQPTVSHHLKVLREAGWITGERCGRFTYYGLVPERARALGEDLVALAERIEAPPSC